MPIIELMTGTVAWITPEEKEMLREFRKNNNKPEKHPINYWWSHTDRCD